MEDAVTIETAAREFLESHRVGRLGTADASGRPHVVPICYALGDRCIYSVIDDKPKTTAPTRLKRIRNILSNPHVCLTVDEYSDDWSKLGFVMVQGVASLIYSGQEHEAATALLRKRYAQYRDMDMTGRPILSIEPQKIVKWGKV
ncbi:MAG: TIGR03668 family PPOX class F420-dependent oxidoreductase [Dehalococcoidia bacterium]